MRHLAPIIAASLALAACAEAEPVSQEEITESKATVTPPAFGSSSGVDRSAMSAPEVPPDTLEQPDRDADVHLTAGPQPARWFSGQMAGAPAALFGQPNTEAQFSIRCEDGELVVSRNISMREGPARIELISGGKIRDLAGSARADPLPTVTGKLPTQDDFAALLAGSSDPVEVRVEAGPPLRMPASKAFRNVVSECGP